MHRNLILSFVGMLLVVALCGGCEKNTPEQAAGTPAAGAAGPADATGAPADGTTPTEGAPAADGTPAPTEPAAVPDKLPVYKVADDNIVVGRSFTYTVTPDDGQWAITKSALCNIGTGKDMTVGRDKYRECLVPTRDIAVQICDLTASWASRQRDITDSNGNLDTEEFELSTGEWCYVDNDAGQIWVAQKSDTGQHHNKWLFAQAAPGQAGKIFACIKAELKARQEELVQRRKAENERLETAGVLN